jgi:hypothetical protein
MVVVFPGLGFHSSYHLTNPLARKRPQAHNGRCAQIPSNFEALRSLSIIRNLKTHFFCIEGKTHLYFCSIRMADNVHQACWKIRNKASLIFSGSIWRSCASDTEISKFGMLFCEIIYIGTDGIFQAKIENGRRSEFLGSGAQTSSTF